VNLPMSSKVMKVPDEIYDQVKAVCDGYRVARDLGAVRAGLREIGISAFAVLQISESQNDDAKAA